MDIKIENNEDGSIKYEDIEIENTNEILSKQSIEYLRNNNLQKLGNQLNIPTDDLKVKEILRALKEPIIYFGEDKFDRRERLKLLCANLYSEGKSIPELKSENDLNINNIINNKIDFYDGNIFTEIGKDLIDSRRWIGHYSLERAANLNIEERKLSKISLRNQIKHRKKINDKLKSFDLVGSQIASKRPLSQVKISPNSKIIVAGSWAGDIKLFNLSNLNEYTNENNEKLKFEGHKDIIGGLSWHPQGTLNQSLSSLNFASSGADHEIKLWSLNSNKPLSKLIGHERRVCRISFHPSGKYLGSASFDLTWRLWDVETQKELLLQEGHSLEVFTIAFQDTGALAATGGKDGIGRIWDLRTGKSIMILDKHSKEIYSLAFSPNGYQIASGSADDTIRIWDIRKMEESIVIPGHTGLVSDLIFYNRGQTKQSSSWWESEKEDLTSNTTSLDSTDIEPAYSGTSLISCSFDGKVNIWSADNWAPIKSLKGHTGKVMSVDISPDMNNIVSAGWDRTVKLWRQER